MPDARHPKPYPRGPKHPKLPVSPEWKRRVDQALEDNKRRGVAPGNRAELARMVKADKGGLKTMLDGDQASYKYARQISDLLGIPDAMTANPELTQNGVGADEWAEAVARARTLPPDEQRRALRMFRAAIDVAP